MTADPVAAFGQARQRIKDAGAGDYLAALNAGWDACRAGFFAN